MANPPRTTDPTRTRPAQGFGSALRWWRTTRRYSQLQLANEAGVSSRHLSCLETGKARPSREMVVHLSVVLDLPLRDRNTLLDEAGFAPLYHDTGLDRNASDTVGSDAVHRVLRTILDAHLPNPALAVDRCGNLVEANTAALMLVGHTIATDSPALQPVPNLNRLTLHPDGIRSRTSRWEEVAANVLARLEREQAHRPADERLAAVLDEMRGYPGVAELRRTPRLPTGDDLLVTIGIRCLDGTDLAMISTIGTIGAPNDVTLDEVRLETFFPADVATRQSFDRWASEL